ncbi:MAG TPA: hypothetical protein VJN18_22255 [Polyangiaceae bacterium]|nr:hypothetical protein [Polyangiaceae bacterium]
MRFDGKARENLDAAERLLPSDEADEVDALCNAAASRAYYAAYLAVAHRAQRDQRPLDERGYYAHDKLADRALAWRILSIDEADDLRLLWGRRVKADYYEDHVSIEEASEAAELAKSFMVLIEEEAS